MSACPLLLFSKVATNHYVRKTQRKHDQMKNGDAQIVHHRHHILHYKVI
jgi:hypothetical protein